jgi:hypothetical protein
MSIRHRPILTAVLAAAAVAMGALAARAADPWLGN